MTSSTPGRLSNTGRVEGALVAGDPDRGALRARDRVGLEAARLDRRHDARGSRSARRVLPHHHQHRRSSRPPRSTRRPACYRCRLSDARCAAPQRRRLHELALPDQERRRHPGQPRRGRERRHRPQAHARRLRPRDARDRRRDRRRHLLDHRHRRGGRGGPDGTVVALRRRARPRALVRAARRASARWPASATPSSPR